MKIDRRTLFRIAGAAGAATALASAGSAKAGMAVAKKGARGVLVDTTLCVGCRGCEAACSEANALAAPETPGDDVVFASSRKTSPEHLTVVNRGTQKSPAGEERFAKAQCLHCVDPACVSGCVARALVKSPSGPVVYEKDRCIGCRYCMVACPFGVPKYEYTKLAPYVVKCTFCASRQEKGLPPACTEVCPSGALLFGERAQLLEVAKSRIYQNPGKYVPRIYGEEEAGGTSWLYISDVPFETLGLKEGVSKRSYPEMAAGALSGVPFVITLWPPLLMGLYTFSKRREQVASAEPGAGRSGEGSHE